MLFHITYQTREREDENAEEKKRLQESVRLYREAKDALETYVYNQKKKEDEKNDNPA
jgi:hypothetical protein